MAEVTKRVSLLRRERQARGLTLREVEVACGVPYSVLQRVETGQVVPSKKHARALYQFYRGCIALGDIYDPMFSIESAS